MGRDIIINDYFEWLYESLCGKRFAPGISYRKLLSRLHCIVFTYSIVKDANRAEDGIDLRYRYASDINDDDVASSLDGPCSVLEMLAALSIRVEESIMDDSDFGDRTGQWFWGMISNLGLRSMIDDRFDAEYVDMVIERLLNREYEPDGSGGLFTIKNCGYDLRKVEIWYQFCWYLENLT